MVPHAPIPPVPRPRAEREEVRQRIFALVDSIPAGRVASYGVLARAAGLPGRARLVGKLLGSLPARSDLPWHRVVSADGRIAERPGDSPREQVRRLRAEGVELRASGRVEMQRFAWDPDGEEQS